MKRIIIADDQVEVSIGQLLINWNTHEVEIAERDFINYDYEVYDFIEVSEDLRGLADE